MIFDDLKGLLELSGLLTNYQFRSIWMESSESDGNAGQRFVIMRRNGGPSDRFVRRFNYQIQVLGKVNELDIAGLESDADGLINHINNRRS